MVLDPAIGGECEQCNKIVSPKLLELDLGTTVAIEDGGLRLDQTLPVSHIPEFNRTSSHDAEELTGDMYGHFKLISPLGRGGMGQVFRALDTSLQRFAAVKLLRSGLEGTEGGLDGGSNGQANGHHKSTRAQPKSSDREIDALLQEAISQARVTHPNIVTIYYVGKQDGNPFLAMELVNGAPLSKSLQDREMPFEEVVGVAIDITKALRFSYDLDIIHGDIKPSNVLLTNGGVAKLSDFGMARSASNQTGSTVGGTPNYIAPEILAGAPPSLQSDIYALGVTLFETTFQSIPRKLTGRTIKAWLESIYSSELVFPTPWPPQLPEQWRDILEKMLNKDPDERYASYDSLLADLNRVKPGSKVPSRLMPRLVAAGIDWSTVLVLAVTVQVALNSPALSFFNASHPWMVNLLKSLNFLPFIAYTVLIYFWRQSIGRNLMHLRVVNQFGMTPSRRAMVLRSAIRMQFPIVVMSRLMFTDLSSSWLEITLAGLLVLSMLFLLAELGSMLFRPFNMAIHDMFARTRVVLDTNQPVETPENEKQVIAPVNPQPPVKK